MKTIWNILIGVAVGILAAGIFRLAVLPPRGMAVTLLPTATQGLITVYVSGAVVHPGMYSLPLGSRIDAAILAAGGFVPGAEQASINLAALLEDGEQIDVPGIVNSTHINAGRVNINIATVSELDALPGIGLTTAQAIVDFRLQNGPFQLIQDIQKVPGIGPATYDLIKNYITVGP